MEIWASERIFSSCPKTISHFINMSACRKKRNNFSCGVFSCHFYLSSPPTSPNKHLKMHSDIWTLSSNAMLGNRVWQCVSCTYGLDPWGCPLGLSIQKLVLGRSPGCFPLQNFLLVLLGAVAVYSMVEEGGPKSHFSCQKSKNAKMVSVICAFC